VDLDHSERLKSLALLSNFYCYSKKLTIIPSNNKLRLFHVTAFHEPLEGTKMRWPTHIWHSKMTLFNLIILFLIYFHGCNANAILKSDSTCRKFCDLTDPNLLLFSVKLEVHPRKSVQFTKSMRYNIVEGRQKAGSVEY
jgi:hypothetical protein